MRFLQYKKLFCSQKFDYQWFKPEFSNKGFEKPYSTDYEESPVVRIFSMVSLNH
jgi:hypothetical protein